MAAVGTAAVTARTIDGYRELIAASGGGARDQASGVRPDGRGPAGDGRAARAAPRRPGGPGFPVVLVATEREQSIPRVAALPDDLREQVVLVIPPRTDGVPAQADPPATGGIRIVEAAPARYERPPKGRGPIARFKRATWTPPLTAEEELAAAVAGAVRGHPPDGLPEDVIALDAPAAVILSGMDARHVRLAPGSLRWLADRWEAERAGRP